MRSIWNGTVSFGLVAIPVKLYPATEHKSIPFQAPRRRRRPHKYKKVCAHDGEEVQSADIAKGYELPTGEEVVLTDSDFDNLPLASARTVEVLQFVPLEQIDPIYYDSSYYLEPNCAITRGFRLVSFLAAARLSLVTVTTGTAARSGESEEISRFPTYPHAQLRRHEAENEKSHGQKRSKQAAITSEPTGYCTQPR